MSSSDGHGLSIDQEIDGNKYIRFRKYEPGRSQKTQCWYVINKSSSDSIGHIQWYTPWRQYCFFPWNNTVWNKDCLETIIKFIKQLTDERKT